MNYKKEAKSLTCRKGSAVSQAWYVGKVQGFPEVLLGSSRVLLKGSWDLESKVIVKLTPLRGPITPLLSPLSL